MDEGIAQLAALIGAHLAECGVERDLRIYGSGDPRAIAVEIDRFCRDELGGAVARPLLYETSQGSVAGLELADARRVVVKAHQPELTLSALHESVRVQMHLASRRRYATTVCGGPAPIGRTLATVEPFVDGGTKRDGHEPVVRAALARSLREIVEACRPLVAGSTLAPHYLARPYAELWPDGNDERHFAARSHGAEWIDDVARAARGRMQDAAGELVIGHGDWRVEQVLFDGDRVVVAHDWVSLCKEREPALVGFTAFAFCVDWSRSATCMAPTLDEARAFVADYEAARGGAFTIDERRLCGALFAYSCAYIARCLWGVDDERERPGSFQHLVAAHGGALVDL